MATAGQRSPKPGDLQQPRFVLIVARGTVQVISLLIHPTRTDRVLMDVFGALPCGERLALEWVGVMRPNLAVLVPCGRYGVGGEAREHPFPSAFIAVLDAVDDRSAGMRFH